MLPGYGLKPLKPGSNSRISFLLLILAKTGKLLNVLSASRYFNNLLDSDSLRSQRQADSQIKLGMRKIDDFLHSRTHW